MQAKRLCILLVAGIVGQITAQHNAFDNDINRCLFTRWTTASGNRDAVLKETVKCAGGNKAQLCYGGSPKAAQFAVCYNKETLTPDFTGHIVAPNIPAGGGRDDWHNEAGTYAPNPQSSVADYDPHAQQGLYPNFDQANQQFLARGHLTPNADYGNANDREMTMVNTNIAPQWQLFNGVNWAALEAAIRAYATAVNRNIYVFTGVAGKARNVENGNEIKLNGVLTPGQYWKAICDPGVGSIVFWGENSVGVTSDDQVQGCNGQMQKKKNGVIYCCSFDRKASEFQLPPFNDNCKTSVKGSFMDGRLNALQ